MIFSILNKCANDGELILVDGGLTRVTIRQDRVITIHEIIVLPSQRRKGIARKMILQLQEENPGYRLRALCPVGYESNKFWEGMGFTHCGIKTTAQENDTTSDDDGFDSESTKVVSLNVWMMEAKGCIGDSKERLSPPTNGKGFVFKGKCTTKQVGQVPSSKDED